MRINKSKFEIRAQEISWKMSQISSSRRRGFLGCSCTKLFLTVTPSLTCALAYLPGYGYVYVCITLINCTAGQSKGLFKLGVNLKGALLLLLLRPKCHATKSAGEWMCCRARRMSLSGQIFGQLQMLIDFKKANPFKCLIREKRFYYAASPFKGELKHVLKNATLYREWMPLLLGDSV